MKYCTKCGAPILPDKKFCTKCGTPIKNEVIEEKKPELEMESTSIFAEDQKTVEEKAYDERKIMQEKVSENNIIEDTSESIYMEKSHKYKNEKKEMVTNTNNNKAGSKVISKVIIGVIIGVVVIAGILAVVFSNNIKGEYYIFKYNHATASSEKVEYAANAVKTLKNDDTKELLKKALLDTSKSDIDFAQAKMQELSSLFTQKEYQSIASEIENVKIDKLYSEGKYEEACKQFEAIYKLGGDFKTNIHYEDIMLNNAAKAMGSQAQNTKEMLLKNNNTYFDNFDEDVYDEIIQITTSGYNEDTRMKVNLFKYINGQYKLADDYLGEYDVDAQIQGIYNYAKGKKGIYLRTIGRIDNATVVLGVENGKLQLKGVVRANNYTGPVDIDKDGIYEVVAKNVSVISTFDKDIYKWFKIYDDGRTPTEVKVTAEQAANNTNTSQENSSVDSSSNVEDYVFKDSDKRYLTDADLADLSKDRLAIARNEIFARHGYIFKMDEFKNYFSSKKWYVPNPSYDGTDTSFNEYEKANYKLIQQWENKK